MKNQSRIYGVDTFRFCAFLNVFLFHATTKWSAGYLGVQLFFVLSSFLLTFLALNEIKNTGEFSRINFFLRRAVRIYPLYFMVVAISFYALPLIANAFNHPVSLPNRQWMYWTFLANFDSEDHLFALKFLWSISVEEQFYILFLCLSFLFKRNIYIPIIGLLLIGFAAPAISRVAQLSDYHNPVTYFADFGIGMLAAKLYFEKHRLVSTRNLVISSFAAGLLAASCFQVFALTILFNYVFAVFAASILLLAIRCFEKRSYHRWLPAVTEVLGKYTYGLYVYSGFVLTFCSMFLPTSNSIVLVVLEFSILTLLAIFSYHFFEKRFLELKPLFQVNRSRSRVDRPLPAPSLEMVPSSMSL